MELVLLKEGTEIEIIAAPSKGGKAAEWKCRTPEESDYRCHKNWFTDKGLTAGATRTPVSSDSIVFGNSVQISNSQLPVATGVTFESKKYCKKCKDQFGDIPLSAGFQVPFVDALGSGFNADGDEQAMGVAEQSSCIDKAADPAGFRKALSRRIQYIQHLTDPEKGGDPVNKVMEAEPLYDGTGVAFTLLVVNSKTTKVNPFTNETTSEFTSAELKELSDKLKKELAEAKVVGADVTVALTCAPSAVPAVTSKLCTAEETYVPARKRCTTDMAISVECQLGLTSTALKESDALTIIKGVQGAAAMYTSGAPVTSVGTIFMDLPVFLHNADGIMFNEITAESTPANAVAAVATPGTYRTSEPAA